METDNNRKRDRDEGSEEKPSKRSKVEENDDFSDDSFEFEINLASQKEQYKLSEEKFKNAKARVKEVFEIQFKISQQLGGLWVRSKVR